ncbi:ABC transporter permease [Brachybacterium sp. AOP42-E1-35]|uniref:ABC transporter permease n=1 Tax=Brachybacterium sp. AOP42-E1-35 TaxID=3457664 RepID=UPI00402AF464
MTVLSTAPIADVSAPPRNKGLASLLRALAGSTTGLIGGIIFGLIVVVSLLAPFFVSIPSSDPTSIYLPLSSEHPLGTDADGRDVLAMLLVGGRDVVVVGLVSATVSTGLAVFLGALAAYRGGWLGSLIIQFTDFVLTIPQFALLLVLAAYIRLDSPVLLALLLGFLGWPGLLRAVRAQVLSLKEREYIEAAKLLDLPTPYIIVREILPNMASYLLIHFIFAMTGAVYSMVGLYLLGLAPMTGTNWGIMINNAWQKGALFSDTSLPSILAPLLIVTIMQLSAVWFSRALEEILNPRLQGDR